MSTRLVVSPPSLCKIKREKGGLEKEGGGGAKTEENGWDDTSGSHEHESRLNFPPLNDEGIQ